MIDPWFVLVLLLITLAAFISGFIMAERYYRGIAKSYEQLRDKYENLSQENNKLKDEVRELKARLNEALCEISKLSADLAIIHGNQNLIS
jgi:cell division protein FtsB